MEAEYVHSANAEELGLREYLHVLIKHRELLIFVFLTVVIIGAYFSFTATALYQASSILKIEPQNPSVTGVGEILRLSESGSGGRHTITIKRNLSFSKAMNWPSK
jgi:uncharacterized protein involved in exopolysaccharide biosynthesis